MTVASDSRVTANLLFFHSQAQLVLQQLQPQTVRTLTVGGAIQKNGAVTRPFTGCIQVCWVCNTCAKHTCALHSKTSSYRSTSIFCASVEAAAFSQFEWRLLNYFLLTLTPWPFWCNGDVNFRKCAWNRTDRFSGSQFTLWGRGTLNIVTFNFLNPSDHQFTAFISIMGLQTTAREDILSIMKK